MDGTRRLAVLVALVAVAVGCASAPQPTTEQRSELPPDARTVAGAITEEGLADRLAELAAVTDASTGYRSVGSPGYDAAADLVSTLLADAGWHVSDDAYEANVFVDDGGSRIEVDGRSFASDDVRPLVFAPSGEVDGPVVAIGSVDRPAARTELGCEAGDYGALPADAIVVVPPGTCFRRDQVVAAQAAGAAAFVAAYPEAPTGSPPRTTLIDPAGLAIPALGATGPAAEALAATAAAGGTARLVGDGRTTTAPTRSVLAELPGSEPGPVVMLGAHLDSVMDGPGMNDDGSGTAALLEIARALGGRRPRSTIRLAFWSAEEAGLIGSRHYVESLPAADREAIVAYFNADMLGSVNGYAGVYDEDGAPAGSEAVGALLRAAVERAGATPAEVALGGGSDHRSFIDAGVPVGGVFSGAGEPVSAAQAAGREVVAGQPADPCYHRTCDELDNVDLGLTRILATALADVAVRVAQNPELVRR
ncbi:MAG TPA: M20/M25/M40 family metallo-hydrolase [Candidatus Limnocylindrales bacterium]|jgi:Zn-dependent M28 family amino/carboxypeptidase